MICASNNYCFFCYSGCYKTLKDNQLVELDPSTVLDRKPDWVLFDKHIFTTKNFIKIITPVEVEWLVKMAPQ